MASLTDAQRPAAFRPELASNLGTSTKTPSWDLATERRLDDGETLANALGWFSIGLGAVELLAAKKLSRFLGVKGNAGLVQLYGLREIGSGVGALSQRRPISWISGRIAGDVLDLITLGAVLSRSRKRANVVGAIAAVAGVTVLDALCAKQLSVPRYQSAEQ